MTKQELVHQVAMRAGMTDVDASIALESVMIEIKNALLRGENVRLRGFGQFIYKKNRRKMVRNITKNEQMILEDRYTVKFKPNKQWIKDISSNEKKFLII